METTPIVTLLRADPFHPFVMHRANGETYTIRHRAQLLVTPNGTLYYCSPPTDPDTTAGEITTMPAKDIASITVTHH